MKHFPVFPLQIVVFPGQKVPLHIFEERYKDMIHFCEDNKKPFVLVAYIDEKVSRIGTLCHIERIDHVYDNGEMDIITESRRRVEIVHLLQQNTYAEADVISFNDETEQESVAVELRTQIDELFTELMTQAQKDAVVSMTRNPIVAYDYANLVGFDLKGKQEIMELTSETARMERVLEHLNEVVPRVKAFERFKDQIRSNGHFKKFPPLNFDIK